MEFEVEKILKKSTDKNGQTKYFVKWRGYTESHNSWVDAKDASCDELIKKFENRQFKTILGKFISKFIVL